MSLRGSTASLRKSQWSLKGEEDHALPPAGLEVGFRVLIGGSQGFVEVQVLTVGLCVLRCQEAQTGVRYRPLSKSVLLVFWF